MSCPKAIVVECLSKKYRIGCRSSAGNTLREILDLSLKSPLRKLKSIIRRESFAAKEKENAFWALKEISFEVNIGDVVGIIGGNGAGKSTLLKILSRITKPTIGKVTLHGRLASLLEVGTGFHPELTGRDNIYLNGSILGMKRSEIREQFDEIVAFAEINNFIDTPVKHYSSGMYIRLAFAVAAHLQPEILIVDEVLAVGDTRFQKKCLGKMGEVAKQGRTVIFVSHNMSAIRSFCTRALLIEKGELKANGQVDTVISQYLNSASQHSMERRWPTESAPSNDSFRIISMKLVDASGLSPSSVYISQDLYIEIQFEVLKSGAQAGFSLILYDNDGCCVFCSFNNLEKEYYGKPLELGTYSTRCQIFANLLTEAQYYVTLVAYGANRSDVFTIDRALVIDAIDDGVLRGDYQSGNYIGQLRPKLEWKTQKISNSC